MQLYCMLIVCGNAIEWNVSKCANVAMLTACSGVLLEKMRGRQLRKRPAALSSMDMFKRSRYQLPTVAG